MKIKAFGMNTLLTCLLLTFAMTNVKAQNTQITVSNIRSSKGKIMLSLFKDEKSFKDAKPFKTTSYEKKGLANGILVLKWQIEPGIYGMALLDDENQNTEMDKNLIGVPKEGFGFSDFYLEKLKAPSFNEFKTEIKSEGNKIQIKVKYM